MNKPSLYDELWTDLRLNSLSPLSYESLETNIVKSGLLICVGHRKIVGIILYYNNNK